MLHPTDKELRHAKELGVNAEGLNGPQLREAIQRAEQREKLRSKGPTPHKMSLEAKQRRALEGLATQLGLDVVAGSMLALRRQVTDRIDELLYQKGIVVGTIIRYNADASEYAGKEAEVVKTDVIWRKELPYLVLRHQGTERSNSYAASAVVLHATVVR